MIMTRNSNCFMWVRNSVIVLFFFCGILSCSPENSLETTARKFGIAITPETHAIVQIGDDGCVNCNQSMINEFCKFIGDRNIYFLLAVSPNKLDISYFLENKNPNIIFCKKEDFEKSQLEFNTKVFLLKNGVLDSTVHFDANNWEEATEYVTEVLSTKK